MSIPDRARPDYPNDCMHPWAHARTYAEVQATQQAAAADLADDSHTSKETRLAPGVYLGNGHALLVGTNQRNLVVVDLGGVIQVAGIDVTDPDHLDAFAEYFQRLAATFRTRHPVPAGADR